MQIDLSSFDLYTLLQDTIQLFAEPAGSKGLKLNLLVAQNVPRLVRADGAKIRHVLLHLLSNAIQFNDSGTISVRVERLPSGESDEGVELRFRVSNIGDCPSGSLASTTVRKTYSS